MGGGSKTKTTSSSVQGSAQDWAKPYAMKGLDSIMGVYEANAPILQQQAQDVRDLTTTFKGNLNKAGSVGNAASGYFNSVMGGKYLTGNPYIDGMIDATNKSVTDQVNGQFTLGGRYGSGAHTGVLTDQLAEAQNALRYQDYGAERDRMTQAAQGSVQADAARAAAEAQAAQTLLAQQQLAAELPYVGSNSLASSLNALFNGGTSNSTITQKSGGGLLDAASTLGAAAIMTYSDPALKKDVVKLGEHPDGLGIYEFSYLGSNDRIVGVMATEVARLRPWALGPVMDGFMTVNYSALERAA